MSSIILSIRFPLCSITEIYLVRLSLVSFDSFSKSEKPRILFIGVRISWLILARKADFNLSLCSACSLAFCNSLFIFLYSSFCASISAFFSLRFFSCLLLSVIFTPILAVPNTSFSSDRNIILYHEMNNSSPVFDNIEFS